MNGSWFPLLCRYLACFPLVFTYSILAVLLHHATVVIENLVFHHTELNSRLPTLSKHRSGWVWNRSVDLTLSSLDHTLSDFGLSKLDLRSSIHIETHLCYYLHLPDLEMHHHCFDAAQCRVTVTFRISHHQRNRPWWPPILVWITNQINILLCIVGISNMSRSKSNRSNWLLSPLRSPTFLGANCRTTVTVPGCKQYFEWRHRF
jgi:hypothetical protein